MRLGDGFQDNQTESYSSGYQAIFSSVGAILRWYDHYDRQIVNGAFLQSIIVTLLALHACKPTRLLPRIISVVCKTVVVDGQAAIYKLRLY